jgi:ribonucleoside-diphosphate reductase alpha chain
LAKEFARIEKKYPNPISYEEILELLESQTILPGGSLLYGIGNDYSISSLGNCFVVGNTADSYGGIFTTDQEQAQLMKRRAGVGHDISHLRPFDAPVTNSAGTSTGAVSFMDRFSNTTREVAQNGRRGALMLSMDINHPDIESFIESKDDLTKLTGANISVKVDDGFMKTIESANNRGYSKIDTYFYNKINVFPEGSSMEDVVDGKVPTKIIPHGILWKKLVHQAWKSAEPGVLFWDKITSESPADCYKEFESVSTNPCGEIPLCPYDSCRLLAINLYSYVENPFTKKAKFNFDLFKEHVHYAQRIMDDVVDLEEEKINKILEKIENDPEPEEIKAIEKNLWLKIKEKLLQGRRTGLSGIGLADTLAALGSGYIDGIPIVEEIYKTLAITAYKSSIDMAKDRGAFPIWDIDKEKSNPFINRITGSWMAINDDGNYWLKYTTVGRRNIALLSIPPSGTISLLAGLSSGIEPVYQLSYKRRRKVDPDHPNISFVDKNGDCWEEYEVLHPKFKEWFLKQKKFV